MSVVKRLKTTILKNYKGRIYKIIFFLYTYLYDNISHNFLAEDNARLYCTSTLNLSTNSTKTRPPGLHIMNRMLMWRTFVLILDWDMILVHKYRQDREVKETRLDYRWHSERKERTVGQDGKQRRKLRIPAELEICTLINEISEWIRVSVIKD